MFYFDKNVDIREGNNFKRKYLEGKKESFIF